jgi:hypothetical protein
MRASENNSEVESAKMLEQISSSIVQLQSRVEKLQGDWDKKLILLIFNHNMYTASCEVSPLSSTIADHNSKTVNRFHCNMEVRKNILEEIEGKWLRWFGHVKRMPGNRLPLKILEWEPEGTRRRGRPKERWIDGVRQSVTNHGLTEEDTRDRDRWRNLVLGEGKPL